MWVEIENVLMREFQNLAEMLLYGRFYSVIPLVDGAVW